MAGQENNSGENAAVQEDTQKQQEASSGQQDAGASPSTAAAAPSQQRPAGASTVHRTQWDQDVVYLYQFCRSGVSPSVSPYCLKVETWLRVAGIKYENVDHKMKYKSKKGQLPFVEVNGAEIADSDVIIRELSKQFHKDLDENLTREDRILSHALCIMLDHHVSWIYGWWRGSNPGEFLKESKMNLQQALGSRIPNGLLTFLFKLKLRGKKGAAVSQGIGVHKPEEIYDFGQRDLEKLNEYLGGKPYFFGEEPTVLDCVAFAHLVQILTSQGDKYPLKVFVEEKCPQLKAFVDRIKERFWPDWEEMCNTKDLNTHLPKPTPPPPQPDDEKKEQDREKDKEKDEDSGENKLEKDEKEKEKHVEDKQQSDNKFEEEKIEEKESK
ncbi:hypothetical protein CHUAL_009275 [Chamberlinius hualienensis]